MDSNETDRNFARQRKQSDTRKHNLDLSKSTPDQGERSLEHLMLVPHHFPVDSEQ